MKQLPNPITSATFICSSPGASQIPQHSLPEYAFIGRSNVGKSSLINMLTGQKKLAHTSATPGKTQLINHFLINNGWYLVDLPGYGYAKISKSQRSILGRIITDYLKNSQQLTLLFVLLDIRLEPQAVDLAFIEQLGEWEIPFALIFTKADKLGPVAAQRMVDGYKNRLLEQWEELPSHFITSAEKGTGRQEVIHYIESINGKLQNHSYL
jgi:GTP-binding protein